MNIRTNPTDPDSGLERRARSDVLIVCLASSGALLSLLICGLLLSLTSIDFSFIAIWRSAEWIAIGSVLILLIVLVTYFKFGDKRPLFSVPLDAALWEYVVFGAFTMTVSNLYLIGLVGVLVILPIVTPAKVVYEYTLSSTASLTSAVIAVPITFFCATVAFAIVYFVAAFHGKGGILAKDKVILQGQPRLGVGWPMSDVLFVSASTMLTGGAVGYELTGWCRWIALAQVLVAKVLELIIVGVGIGLIMTRLLK